MEEFNIPTSDPIINDDTNGMIKLNFSWAGKKTRAGWKGKLSKYGVYEIVGYDGEDSITIFMMGMQDCSTDIVVVKSQVDGPHEVFQERVEIRPIDFSKIEEATLVKINKLVRPLMVDPLAE